jgi:hypothetical protein
MNLGMGGSVGWLKDQDVKNHAMVSSMKISCMTSAKPYHHWVFFALYSFAKKRFGLYISQVCFKSLSFNKSILSLVLSFLIAFYHHQ